MRFIRADNEDRVGGPDITSMIDVVFLLIIFFLTTSSLIQMTRIPLDLPEEAGETQDVTDSPALVINIEADGTIVVDNVTVDLDRLLRMIGSEIEAAANGTDLEVLLRADQSASLSHVNQIAEGMIGLGVRSWRLATRVPRVGAGGD
ncbi:MAG: ExbD/TolR family protein [Phycisphaerales bacterium]